MKKIAINSAIWGLISRQKKAVPIVERLLNGEALQIKGHWLYAFHKGDYVMLTFFNTLGSPELDGVYYEAE